MTVQVLEAQMLPATAPFYMGLAAGWGVLVGKYVEHSGEPLSLQTVLILYAPSACLQCLRPLWYDTLNDFLTHNTTSCAPSGSVLARSLHTRSAG